MRLDEIISKSIKSFLSEGYSEAVSDEKIKEILKSKCSSFVKEYKNKIKNNDELVLYRGDKTLDQNSCHFCDSSKRKIRKSANTANYYTILFSKLLDSWKMMPKRDKGVICSTAEFTAHFYNNSMSSNTNNKAFVVVPFDGNKIALCPDADIWFSFDDKAFEDLNDFNEMLFETGFSDTEEDVKKILKMSAYDFIEAIKSNNKNVRYVKNAELFFDVAWRPMKAKSINVKDHLESFFDPKRNGFEIVTSLNSLKKNREAWFDGSCVLIPPNKLKDIINDL